MYRATQFCISIVIAYLACGSSHAAATSQAEKEASMQRSSELQSPIEITYRVIGAPIVGSPVAIDLQFRSTLGNVPYTVTYRVNDETALQLPDVQSESVSISPSSSDEIVAQQVTVVPLREGRLYLNVAAVVETDAGSMQTVTAVPIQVGQASPRQIQENGTVTTDADGNQIRSLPATEN